MLRERKRRMNVLKKMKKTAAFLAAAMLMTAAAASAEDIAALSDQDLMTLYRQVAEEVENRGIVPQTEWMIWYPCVQVHGAASVRNRGGTFLLSWQTGRQ